MSDKQIRQRLFSAELGGWFVRVEALRGQYQALIVTGPIPTARGRYE